MTALLGYLEPSRHYHTFEHIGYMHDGLVTYFPESADSEALKLAITYHDCVYTAGDPANEELSADAMLQELEGSVDPDVLGEAARLIMLTKDHTVRSLYDEIGKVLIDLDLAGLGSSQQRYDRNTATVRQEFGAVSEQDWRAGREKFLRGMLDRSRIFLTETGADLWEAPARQNLERELASLEEAQVLGE